MCVALFDNPPRGGLHELLAINPTISNGTLAGVVKANLPQPFQTIVKYVRCSDGRFRFRDRDTDEPVKIFYLSPYGYWTDLFVSIKRIFTGIKFPPPNRNWQDQLNQLARGRRVAIFVPLDRKKLEVYGEGSKPSLWGRICACFADARQRLSQSFYVWWYTRR